MSSFHTICQRAQVCFFILIAVLSPFTSCLATGADPNEFPHYRAIVPNVLFWEKIYSTHSITTSVIHDAEHLDRVYAVIPLLDESQADARRKNDQKINNTKDFYAELLLQLARNPHPKTTEEKRIMALFGGAPKAAELKRAAENIRAQQGLKERFIQGVIRSGAYMETLKRIFASHGLPEDLTYLPHVESSFDPKAFSRFGASGMWQFTHTTGKDYLHIDYIVDERRDPFISAEAAARFLKRNHQVLGTWPLALTAYNYGTSGMKRAQKQEGDYEEIFKNYRQGYFKFAARNFYSEFLAAVKVAKKLEQSSKFHLDRPFSFVSVSLPGYADSAKLCTYLGIDTEVLRRYNPALREPVYEGTKYIPKDYTLKLPPHFKGADLLHAAPPSIFSPEQKRSRFYQVRPGDSAGAIALAHNVSLSRLLKANNLDRRGLIRVGQNLRIPPKTGAATHTQDRLARTSSGPTLKDDKKTLPTGHASSFRAETAVVGNLKVFNVRHLNSAITGTVEVQPDESIALFADWLQVSARSITDKNNMRPDSDIFPDQTLSLDFRNVSIDAFEETRFDFHQEKQEDFFHSYTVVGIKSYRVRAGDTIWNICHKTFDLPLWLLRKYNNELKTYELTPSTTLKIPILKQI